MKVDAEVHSENHVYLTYCCQVKANVWLLLTLQQWRCCDMWGAAGALERV